MSKKYKIAEYRVYTYDVWGNAKDGFDVNDVYPHGTVDIKCKCKVYNKGTPGEFAEYSPTDRQLSRAAGFRGVSWEGETEYTLHAESSRSGRPIGELRFVRWVD